MAKTTPSFAQTAFVVLMIVVVPLSAATVTAVFVRDWFTVGLIFIFSLTLLLTVIPYFALVNNQISSKAYLKTYVEILDRIPLVRLVVRNPERIILSSGIADAMRAVVQRRIQARDWKFLHQECQAISLKLVVLHGTVNSGDFQVVLHDLETLWSMECSGMVRRFSKLQGLSDGLVRQEFISSDEYKRWFADLEAIAVELDTVISICYAADDLSANLPGIRVFLSRLQRITSELLYYFDSKLQRTINELEREIEVARADMFSS